MKCTPLRACPATCRTLRGWAQRPPLGDDLHQICFLSRERAFKGTVQKSALLARTAHIGADAMGHIYIYRYPFYVCQSRPWSQPLHRGDTNAPTAIPQCVCMRYVWQSPRRDTLNEQVTAYTPWAPPNTNQHTHYAITPHARQEMPRLFSREIRKRRPSKRCYPPYSTTEARNLVIQTGHVTT